MIERIEESIIAILLATITIISFSPGRRPLRLSIPAGAARLS
jgi:hypothetical protein